MSSKGLGIDRNDLEEWIDTREAPHDISRLIRKLVLETKSSLDRQLYASGDGIAAGAWDSIVGTTSPTGWVLE